MIPGWAIIDQTLSSDLRLAPGSDRLVVFGLTFTWP